MKNIFPTFRAIRNSSYSNEAHFGPNLFKAPNLHEESTFISNYDFAILKPRKKFVVE